MLQVKRTVKTITKVELEVFFAGERLKDNDACDLKVIGSPFKRSCSVYKDGDLVAQVHKLKFTISLLMFKYKYIPLMIIYNSSF